MKVKVRQGDRSVLAANFVIDTSFKTMDSSLVLNKFGIDAGVVNIGNRDDIVSLAWLTENRFSIDI